MYYKIWKDIMEESNKPEPTKKVGRPKDTPKVKLNRIQVEELINESMKQIIGKHLSYTEYIKWAKRNYGVSGQQANEYWLRVWTHLKEKYELDRDKLITKHLTKYWGIYDLAISGKDLSNARQTLDAIAKLMGLNEPDKLDMNTKGEITFKFGDE